MSVRLSSTLIRLRFVRTTSSSPIAVNSGCPAHLAHINTFPWKWVWQPNCHGTSWFNVIDLAQDEPHEISWLPIRSMKIMTLEEYLQFWYCTADYTISRLIMSCLQRSNSISRVLVLVPGSRSRFKCPNWFKCRVNSLLSWHTRLPHCWICAIYDSRDVGVVYRIVYDMRDVWRDIQCIVACTDTAGWSWRSSIIQHASS